MKNAEVIAPPHQMVSVNSVILYRMLRLGAQVMLMADNDDLKEKIADLKKKIAKDMNEFANGLEENVLVPALKKECDKYIDAQLPKAIGPIKR